VVGLQGDRCDNCHRIIQSLYDGAEPRYLDDRRLCPTCCTHEEIFGLPWPRRKPPHVYADVADGTDPGSPASATGRSTPRDGAHRPAASQAAAVPKERPPLARPAGPSATTRPAAATPPALRPTAAAATSLATPNRPRVSSATEQSAGVGAPRVPASAAVTLTSLTKAGRALVLVAAGGPRTAGWRPAVVRFLSWRGADWRRKFQLNRHPSWDPYLNTSFPGRPPHRTRCHDARRASRPRRRRAGAVL